jgi:hypothetical protein
MGKEWNRYPQQEEATNDDDTSIPYHLWDSRLTKKWTGDELLKPHNYAAGRVFV